MAINSTRKQSLAPAKKQKMHQNFELGKSESRLMSANIVLTAYDMAMEIAGSKR